MQYTPADEAVRENAYALLSGIYTEQAARQAPFLQRLLYKSTTSLSNQVILFAGAAALGRHLFPEAPWILTGGALFLGLRQLAVDFGRKPVKALGRQQFETHLSLAPGLVLQSYMSLLSAVFAQGLNRRLPVPVDDIEHERRRVQIMCARLEEEKKNAMFAYQNAFPAMDAAKNIGPLLRRVFNAAQRLPNVYDAETGKLYTRLLTAEERKNARRMAASDSYKDGSIHVAMFHDNGRRFVSFQPKNLRNNTPKTP